MRLRRIIWLGATIALGAAAQAQAAVSSLALDTGFDGAAPTSPSLRAWLGPSLGVESASGTLLLDGRFGGSPLMATGSAARLRLSTMLRHEGLLRPELVVVGAARQDASGLREGLRFHLAGARGGAWISAAAEAASTNDQRPSLHLPLLGFGAWARDHRLMFAGAVEQHMGLLRARRETAAPDTGRGAALNDLGPGLRFDPRQVMLSTAYASVRWEGDRFELESIGGVTVGTLTTPRRWAQSSLSWRLSPQLALVAAAGSRSPQYWSLDPAGERQAALSLRFSQSVTAASRLTIVSRAEAVECRLRPMGEGLWRVAVRAPGARLVELQSDATQWQPLTMRPVGGGRWEVEVELSPGIHQLGLRVDGGAWLPPPGFPAQPDGFGGNVGVAVIE